PLFRSMFATGSGWPCFESRNNANSPPWSRPFRKEAGSQPPVTSPKLTNGEAHRPLASCEVHGNHPVTTNLFRLGLRNRRPIDQRAILAVNMTAALARYLKRLVWVFFPE